MENGPELESLAASIPQGRDNALILFMQTPPESGEHDLFRTVLCLLTSLTCTLMEGAIFSPSLKGGGTKDFHDRFGS